MCNGLEIWNYQDGDEWDWDGEDMVITRGDGTEVTLPAETVDVECAAYLANL